MKASAPASSANLGSGFDCLALALDIRCTVEVTAGREWRVAPEDPGGFVETAARTLSTDPLNVSVESEIPIGRGLGSSAAVLAALTTAIRRHQGKPDDRETVFEFVTATEGHPDNAAAAVYGGLMHSGPGGVYHLEIHPSLHPVVVVPMVTLPTREARDALPDTVPFAVACRTASRLLRLVEALRTGNIELLRSIGPDELHEPHRIALRPVIGDLMAAARSVDVPFVAISGSGPSVLALTTGTEVDKLRAAFEEVGSSEVLLLRVASDGVG